MSGEPDLAQDLVHVLEDANATRYLSVIGLVILFYDHLLTFDDEVKLIWHAPASIPKFGFLLNRYMVLGCLIAMACDVWFLCNFIRYGTCRQFLFTLSMFGIISVGIANILVLLRVVILWEHRSIILKLMSFGFLSGFTIQLVTMILANIRLAPYVSWSPVARMCVVTARSPLYVAVWVSPMLFEILVLISTIVNAFDRPRTAHTPITLALHRDGVVYFIALTVLRALNLAFAATSSPLLTLLAVFFVWAMTTTVLNRSLLNLRQAELDESVPSTSGRASPFGLHSHANNSSVHIVDLDDITLNWDAERGGHSSSESVGSSAKLVMIQLPGEEVGSGGDVLGSMSV